MNALPRRTRPLWHSLAWLALAQLTACSPKDTGDLPGWKITRLVTRCTVGAAFKNPVGSARIGGVVMRDRLRSLFPDGATAGLRAGSGSQALHAGAGAGGDAFEALLDREKLPARTSGSLQFYIDGKTFFPVYLAALQAARQSIDVQTFIFDNDDFAVQVADVLRAKSHEVPVRVLFDGLGSEGAATVHSKSMPADFTPPKDMRAYLTSGSKVVCRRTGNAFMMADHSKLHIIDGTTAFAGGMNVGREYRYEWHDLMARVEGPMVQELARLYERRWRSDAWWRSLGRGRPAAVGGQAQQPPAGRQVPLRLLQTDSRRGRHDILQATLLGIRCARRRVWIETPYFSCDALVAELQAALKRGVEVRIVVPEKADEDIMNANNAEDLKKLIDHGAKAWAYPGMTHLKATVCDDWAMFGSANYDTLSQRINVEMNLATSDPATVKTLAARVFEHDFRTGRPITAAMAAARGSAAVELLGDQL